ncbi:MAG: PSD1 and planctomycete cytochrome C domain-containing protein [Chthoniobacteraceae bacterium]
MKRTSPFAQAVVALLACCALRAFDAAGAPVDFARDILPIFQRSCFECHDAKVHKGDLRLDSREEAFASLGVIEKGNAAKSELYRRITLPKGRDDVMPNRGEPLTKTQTEKVKAWIDAGAVWPDGVQIAKHWAYVAPVRPAVPDVAALVKARAALPAESARAFTSAATNPIDAFVLARLQEEGLQPSPEASPETLVRRLHLDLIGIPPPPAEVDAFVKSASANRDAAVESLVDRLLASDQFGVRWARPWLDYARYADSHGFQRDDFRDLWPYRDWVVKALNADMPFTQFTIEQIAGDLLPDATDSQRIATGFNRSAPTNVEAGTDPEETRVNQIHDRVNTLGMTWLGATLECAQCHDHKYDPISQKDYYGIFAFFNSTALEADRAKPNVPGSIAFQGPAMDIADASTQAAREKIRRQIAALTAQMDTLEKSAGASLAEWESALGKQLADSPKEHVLDVADFESTGGATHEILPDKSVLISGEPAPDTDTYVIEVRTKLTGIRGFKLEALTHDSLPGKGPGRGDAERPNFVLNNFIVSATPAGASPAKAPPGKAPAKQKRDAGRKAAAGAARPSTVADAASAEGVVRFTAAQASHSQPRFDVANLLKTGNDSRSGWAINPRFHESHWAIFETAAPVGFEGGTVLRFTLEQNLGAGRTIGRVRLGAITGDVGGKSLPDAVAAALARPAARRNAKDRKLIADFRLKQDPEYARLDREKAQLDARLRKLKVPTTLVMQEDTPRMSTVFQRGEFRTPGEKVQPHTPAILHPLDAKTPPTRLDLARWLVSRENPVVSRVVVNRWWAELFGRGIVSTPEDFGIKGEPPTHPELLDWLAVEFMENGWSMKKTLKTIVTSRTYRQASRMTPELLARDDQNLLLARGPRHRLEAEMIRDNALAIAGLLSLRHGGEPIRPYQPDGLWVKVGGQRYDYEVSPGEEKYRRGLYVVWKRGAPYPSFVNFDANARMACRVKRPRSNTPLQALTLMNDPVYVEAAMAFAKRVLVEKFSGTDTDRIAHAFRLATARAPREAETAALMKLLAAGRESRSQDAKGAQQFVGTFALPEGVTPEEFAAWYAVAAALLNLDETISKG